MEYEKELLKFQYLLGVENIFDFITGRDFHVQKHQQNVDNIEQQTNHYLQLKNNNIQISKQEEAQIPSNHHIEMAVKNLNQISTFNELINEIKNYYGCKLKLHAKNDVIFDGKIDAKIMLIGEAPGEKEDEEGIPFCGQSGQLLRKAISYINLSTEKNLLITNTVYWRPPMNRKPDENEISQCIPFLYKMIDIVKPEIIILCGATAISAIMQTNKKVSDMVGKFDVIPSSIVKNLNINIKNIPTFSLYHPSYLLRNPSMKRIFWQHLLILKQYLKKNSLI